MVRNSNHTSKEEQGRLEEIHDRLSGALQVSPGIEILICKTLLRLPQSVQNFVCEKCMFIEFGANSGMCLSRNRTGGYEWLIFLGSGADESIICHEVAHSILGHKSEIGWNDPYSDEALKQEQKSCELVKSWGFKGPGTEVET